MSNIIGAVQDLPSQMASIGSNIVEGVWNGITSMGSWLASKVKGFFNGIVEGAKKALGIHSPSRVFRDEVGKYMAQGVGVGFEDESKNVQRKLDRSASEWVSTIQGTINVGKANSIPTSVATTNYSVINNSVSNTENRNAPNEESVFILKNYIDSDEVSEYTYKKVNNKLALAGKKVR